MIRSKTIRSGIIIAAISLAASFLSVAENVTPNTNVFAEKGFTHILGPSPAISPSAQESAVDSLMIESCDVLKDLDSYYWYYHARSRDQNRWPRGYRICVATAPTPLGPWEKYGNNPILDQGPEGSWDSNSVDGAVVMKQGSYGTKSGTELYYMWYAADGPTGRHIGLASASSPLGPWKKFAGNPVLRDFGYLGGVVRKDGKFYMFAQHPVGHGTDQGPLELATADHPEGPWTKFAGNPVMTPGDWGAWDDGGFSESRVRFQEGIFHCFFGGTKTPKLESIGYAYSFDGIDWRKYAANPVVPLSSVPDAAGLAEVHALMEGSYVYLYHTLRFRTGQGTARGLSSYPTRGARRPATVGLSQPYDIQSMKWRTEDLGIQVLTIDPHFKVSFPVLMVPALAPQQSTHLQECLPIGLENAATLTLTAECTYDAGATAAIRMHVRASQDGVHCDTVDLHAWNLVLQPGKAARRSWDVHTGAKFAKVFIENLDTAHPVSAVKVVATVGK